MVQEYEGIQPGHFEKVERERDWHTAGERERERRQCVCKGERALGMEEGCWYEWWDGRVEELGAGWVGRRVAGLRHVRCHWLM